VYDLPPGLNAEQPHEGPPQWQFYSTLWQYFERSGHLTTDASEADFFFVPVAQFVKSGWSYGNILLGLRYVIEAHPWFNASGGADHILYCVSDYGCSGFANYPGVERVHFLTHWGSTAKDVRYANTCLFCGPSYTPGKDVVIPDDGYMLERGEMKVGPPQRNGKRSTLIFFYGSGTSAVRQALFKQPWRNAQNVIVGGDEVEPGRIMGTSHSHNLTHEMDRARFCLVPPGAGFTNRGTLAVLRGCIPVTIGDNIEHPWTGLLDWSTFSLHVAEAELGSLLDKVSAVSREEEERMRDKLFVRPLHKIGRTAVGSI